MEKLVFEKIQNGQQINNGVLDFVPYLSKLFRVFQKSTVLN
jgi:hypothetical protein